MRKTILAAICAALGLLAAFTLTAGASTPPTIPDLPGLGYQLSMQFDAQTQCGNYVVTGGNGVDREILIGDLPPRCSTADEEASRIEALLAEFPPPGQAPVTTTVYATTTETLPALTVASPPVTLPAVTVTAPPVTLPAETTTVTLPAVTVSQPVPGPTVTQTVTETVSVPTSPPASDTGSAWLAALAIRSQAMNDLYSLT